MVSSGVSVAANATLEGWSVLSEFPGGARGRRFGAVPTPLERLRAAFEGRYEIEREVGSGGMATVYVAKDRKHDRRVAIKVLRPELAAALLLACGLAVAACAPEPEPSPDVTLRLDPYFRDLRIVRVRAPADTLDLLFDTGGGMTLVTPEVAVRNGCTPYGRDVGHRMSGEPVEFARCDSLVLQVAGWSHVFTPVGVFDVNALLPPPLPPLDGVLALDAFAGEVLAIDLAAGRATLHRAGADSVAAWHALPFRPATGMSGGSLVAMARVDGWDGPLWFLLDSGNLTGTRVARWIVQDSLLPLTPDGAAVLHIGGRADTLPFTAADLAIDGALGTDYFLNQAVVLDLRGMR